MLARFLTFSSMAFIMMVPCIGPRSSITAVIANSDTFSRRFAQNVKNQDEDIARRIKNLRLAKHRYDSVSNNLGRLIRHIDAMLTTAAEIHLERKSAVGGLEAGRFLSFIDAEVLVMLALLADAADEGLMLVRAWDCEGTDVALVRQEIADFYCRIHTLFVDEAVWTTSGYTQFLIKHIQQSGKVVWVRGEPRQIGGPGSVTAGIKTRCIGRMKAWVALAADVLKAEFPEWELCQAMSLFNLTLAGVARPASAERGSARHARKRAEEKTQSDMFHRLANAYGVDHTRLKAQYEDHLPIASKAAITHGADNLSAWQASLKRTQGRKLTRQRHPVDALRPVLVGYGGLGVSTSGVEHSFATSRWLLGTTRTYESEEAEADAIKVVKDRKPAEEVKVIEHAQRTWLRLGFGAVRSTSREERIDKNTQKPSQQKHPTEIGFLRERRKSVDAAVGMALAKSSASSSSGAGGSAPAASSAGSAASMPSAPEVRSLKRKLGDLWTDKHEQ
jgi:hypothetical protein